MKHKFKLLAIAAALALPSVGALAQNIDVSTNPSLLLVAYDSTGSGKTYVRNVGTLSSINGTNDSLFNAPASSVFATALAGVSAANIGWGVFALDNVTQGVYGTGKLTNLGGLGSFDVVSVASVLTNGLGGLTQLDIAANGWKFANGEYTGSTSTSPVTGQTNGLILSSNFEFGTPLAYGHGVGTSQNFLQVDVDGNASQLFLNSQLSAFDGNAKGGYFTLLDAAGDLKWTAAAAVAAVPLPAGALLLAPGLMAMLGLRRRNDKQA